MSTDTLGTTLQVKWSGKTLVWAAFILPWLIFGLELLVRQPIIQSLLPPPNYGTPNYMFDLKVERLEQAPNKYECFFLGNSAVQFGLSPIHVEQAYAQISGKQLPCFNFGAGGILPITNAHLAEVLAKDQQPRLIIFGLNELGFDLDNELTDVGDSSWLRYQRGQADFDDWLVEHLYLYRYYLRLQRMKIVGYRGSFEEASINYFFMHPLGLNGFYSPTGNPYVGHEAQLNLDQPPDIFGADAHVLTRFSQFKFSAKQTQAFAVLANLQHQNPNLQILLVEMPIHSSFANYYGDPQQRSIVQSQLAQLIHDRSLRYWPVEMQPAWVDQDWWDRIHFNSSGAQHFSTWLGQRLAQAVLSGELPDPTFSK